MYFFPTSSSSSVSIDFFFPSLSKPVSLSFCVVTFLYFLRRRRRSSRQSRTHFAAILQHFYAFCADHVLQ